MALRNIDNRYQVERAHEIFCMWWLGATYREIGLKYEIGKQRVATILHWYMFYRFPSLKHWNDETFDPLDDVLDFPRPKKVRVHRCFSGREV